MTEQQPGDGTDGTEEATEAAQNVADSVESWEYSAEEETVRDKLDEGLDEAGVEVPEGEREKLVEQITDEDSSPDVSGASPDEPT